VDRHALGTSVFVTCDTASDAKKTREMGVTSCVEKHLSY
jgi:hypothetical protein